MGRDFHPEKVTIRNSLDILGWKSTETSFRGNIGRELCLNLQSVSHNLGYNGRAMEKRFDEVVCHTDRMCF